VLDTAPDVLMRMVNRGLLDKKVQEVEVTREVSG